MFDILATTIFVLLCAILLFDAILKWRHTRKALYMAAGVLAALAALAFISNLEWGFAALLPALVVRLIAGVAASRSPGSDAEKKPPD